MARSSKRRSTRAARDTPPASLKSTGSPTPEATQAAERHSDGGECPACTPETLELMNGARKEMWIECDNCNAWYHWLCAGSAERMENIAKW